MKTVPNVSNRSPIHHSRDADVIATVPKEAFKAMFYLFAGKPDSKVKMMNRRVIIKFDDLQDLNVKIVEALAKPLGRSAQGTIGLYRHQLRLATVAFCKLKLLDTHRGHT
jgi:hypothetical protein